MIHPPLKTHFPAPNAGQEKFNSHPVAPTCLALFELKNASCYHQPRNHANDGGDSKSSLRLGVILRRCA